MVLGTVDGVESPPTSPCPEKSRHSKDAQKMALLLCSEQGAEENRRPKTRTIEMNKMLLGSGKVLIPLRHRLAGNSGCLAVKVLRLELP